MLLSGDAVSWTNSQRSSGAFSLGARDASSNGASQGGDSWQGSAVVVGAGVSGLQAARALTQAGYRVIILDAQASVGGCWLTCDPGALLQCPWQEFCFPEFPWPRDLHGPADDAPVTAAQVLAYISAYAHASGLMECCRFGCTLTRLSCQPWGTQHMEQGNAQHAQPVHRWAAMFRDAAKSTMQVCAAVVVIATGAHAYPFTPTYPGQSSFQGRQAHARDVALRSAGPQSALQGADVVLLGSSHALWETLAEAAAAQHGASCTLVQRKAAWPVSRFPMSSVLSTYSPNLDELRAVPFYTQPQPGDRCGCLPEAITAPTRSVARRKAAEGLRTVYGAAQDSQGLGLSEPLESGLVQGVQLVRDSEQWAPALRHPHLTVVTGRVRFAPDGLVLESGELLPANCVVYCTGYAQRYPFLDAQVRRLLDVQPDGLHLYRSILHPHLQTLAFVGSTVDTTNALLTAGLQSEWLVRMLTHATHLPCRQAMRADVEAHKGWRRRHLPPAHDRSAQYGVYTRDYWDQLMTDMHYTPPKRAGWLSAVIDSPSAQHAGGWLEEYHAPFPRVASITTVYHNPLADGKQGPLDVHSPGLLSRRSTVMSDTGGTGGPTHQASGCSAGGDTVPAGVPLSFLGGGIFSPGAAPSNPDALGLRWASETSLGSAADPVAAPGGSGEGAARARGQSPSVHSASAGGGAIGRFTADSSQGDLPDGVRSPAAGLLSGLKGLLTRIVNHSAPGVATCMPGHVTAGDGFTRVPRSGSCTQPRVIAGSLPGVTVGVQPSSRSFTAGVTLGAGQRLTRPSRLSAAAMQPAQQATGAPVQPGGTPPPAVVVVVGTGATHAPLTSMRSSSLVARVSLVRHATMTAGLLAYQAAVEESQVGGVGGVHRRPSPSRSGSSPGIILGPPGGVRGTSGAVSPLATSPSADPDPASGTRARASRSSHSPGHRRSRASGESPPMSTRPSGEPAAVSHLRGYSSLRSVSSVSSQPDTSTAAEGAGGFSHATSTAPGHAQHALAADPWLSLPSWAGTGRAQLHPPPHAVHTGQGAGLHGRGSTALQGAVALHGDGGPGVASGWVTTTNLTRGSAPGRALSPYPGFSGSAGERASAPAAHVSSSRSLLTSAGGAPCGLHAVEEEEGWERGAGTATARDAGVRDVAGDTGGNSGGDGSTDEFRHVGTDGAVVTAHTGSASAAQLAWAGLPCPDLTRESSAYPHATPLLLPPAAQWCNAIRPAGTGPSTPAGAPLGGGVATPAAITPAPGAARSPPASPRTVSAAAGAGRGVSPPGSPQLDVRAYRGGYGMGPGSTPRAASPTVSSRSSADSSLGSLIHETGAAADLELCAALERATWRPEAPASPSAHSRGAPASVTRAGTAAVGGGLPDSPRSAVAHGSGSNALPRPGAGAGAAGSPQARAGALVVHAPGGAVRGLVWPVSDAGSTGLPSPGGTAAAVSAAGAVAVSPRGTVLRLSSQECVLSAGTHAGSSRAGSGCATVDDVDSPPPHHMGGGGERCGPCGGAGGLGTAQAAFNRVGYMQRLSLSGRHAARSAQEVQEGPRKPRAGSTGERPSATRRASCSASTGGSGRISCTSQTGRRSSQAACYSGSFAHVDTADLAAAVASDRFHEILNMTTDPAMVAARGPPSLARQSSTLRSTYVGPLSQALLGAPSRRSGGMRTATATHHLPLVPADAPDAHAHAHARNTTYNTPGTAGAGGAGGVAQEGAGDGGPLSQHTTPERDGRIGKGGSVATALHTARAPGALTTRTSWAALVDENSFHEGGIPAVGLKSAYSRLPVSPGRAGDAGGPGGASSGAQGALALPPHRTASARPMDLPSAGLLRVVENKAAAGGAQPQTYAEKSYQALLRNMAVGLDGR